MSSQPLFFNLQLRQAGDVISDISLKFHLSDIPLTF